MGHYAVLQSYGLDVQQQSKSVLKHVSEFKIETFTSFEISNIKGQ